MDGQNVINEIAFSQSVINIGSDSGNDIVLRGAKVADFHAMLNYAGSTWHLIPLDPANYFVSYVPVHVNLPWILAADAAAFLGILALLWLPSLVISTIDPARTVKAD